MHSSAHHHLLAVKRWVSDKFHAIESRSPRKSLYKIGMMTIADTNLQYSFFSHYDFTTRLYFVHKNKKNDDENLQYNTIPLSLKILQDVNMILVTMLYGAV